MTMTSPEPIDLAKIAWTGGGVSRFEVSGQEYAQALALRDDTTTFQTENDAALSHDLSTGTATVELGIELRVMAGVPPQPTGISGRFELVFLFSIGNLTELLSGVEGPIPAVHPQLALLLTSVAYSTARGILHTRLAGTPLEGINLPLINPRQLLQPAPPPAAPKPRRAAPKRRPQPPR